MGIPVEDPTFIYWDNQSAVMNTGLPYSMLKNKRNSTAYHFVHEGSEKYEWRCGRVGIDDKPSYLMKKYYINGDNHIRKVQILIYDIL